jgi:hypothetical protein
MRSWLTAKIQSVSQKYTKVEEEGANPLEEAHLEKIYSQIIEKAELLIKIDPPKHQIKNEV